MKKEKIIDVRLIDAEPPEHVKKMREIIANTNIPDDEFCLLVTGKKDSSKGKGFNMFSGYHIGADVERKEMARAFFSDLMLLEMKSMDNNVVFPFLMAASEIIMSIKEKEKKIENTQKPLGHA